MLEYFNAPPDEYAVDLHAKRERGAEAGRRSLSLSRRRPSAAAADNHNSVNGIREFARAQGAAVDYMPVTVPDLRIDPDALAHCSRRRRGATNLFAFPAQSNFSGVQHPLDSSTQAHVTRLGRAPRRGRLRADQPARPSHGAARLRSLSFYKMFGYPTGVGCLLARHRRWLSCGGRGSPAARSSSPRSGPRHVLAPREAAFEDGTSTTWAFPAVEIGLRHCEPIGIDDDPRARRAV